MNLACLYGKGWHCKVMYIVDVFNILNFTASPVKPQCGYKMSNKKC